MNLKSLTRCAALLLLLAAGSLPAEGQTASDEAAQSEDLSSPVRNGSKTTYLDLLRELFPDLQEDATAHTTIPLRSLAEPGNKQAVTGDIEFKFKPYWINSEGRRLLALWVEITDEDANQGTPYQGGAVVLAVFRLEPNAKLLDAMRVEADRFASLWDKPILRLDARNDAIIFYNHHWNAGENFNDIDMVFVDAGRLKTITNQFIFNFTTCGAIFDETPAFRVVPDPSNQYPQVLVKVVVTRKPENHGCEPRGRGYTRTYQGLYRWDKAKRRYEGHSPQLDRFDRFNKRWLSR